ncbi:MAG TPA: DUF202 domain-containing protein [Candidatus Omnitrophica bacterium]|nr:DUF202 domain-containing protein [Candidatus Omnitrophota bacterium]
MRKGGPLKNIMENPDELRTNLANERTLLAYVRTALALAVSGMAAIKFFPESPLVVSLGWLAVAGGIMLLAWGIVHIRKVSGNSRQENRE